MTFDNLLDRLWLFDFEVTQYDWLLVLNKYRGGDEVIFHNSLPNEVSEFIDSEQPILLGHNAKYYDQYILKSILSGFTMNEIKNVNDYLISGNGQGFEINYDYKEKLLIWDTIQDIVPQKSLKEIEANLLLDITESSIDFDIDHKWNEKEYDEMLFYCKADVRALKPLFEARIDYFETKFDICKLSNIDPEYNIGLTNAKLCAKFLEATLVKRDDEREYVIPKVIDTSVIDKRILDFFDKIHDKSISDDELFKSKLTFEEHGMPTVVSWGGKHGALANYYYNVDENPDVVLINADFASLYPHLLALPQYNFISRNIKDKQKYYDTLQKRLELKHLGKKKEQLALKLILNTTYGCELNKYNDLYDPLKARSTCITGQLLISELSEKVFNIGDVKLVQVNTDGLMVEIPKNKLDIYYKTCKDFSQKCGIELEYDIIDKIYQRDVNNYIMRYGEEGHKKIKAKGGCFSSLPRLEITESNEIKSYYEPNFKSNSLAIVSEALAKFLINGTPIEDTINNCDIIYKFQQVSHLGSTYEKCVQESPNGDIKLQKNNRIYAGKNPSGTIIKVKPNGRRDSLANCPPNPIVDNANKCTINDINKQWYIDLAKQWANDFLGVKRLEEYKKDELIEYAKNKNIEIDNKMKKDEIIKLLKNKEKSIEHYDTLCYNINERKGKDNMATKTEMEEKLTKSIEQNEKLVEMMNSKNLLLFKKINELRKFIRDYEFILDGELPKNLGGKDYYRVDQFYDAIQEGCIKIGLDFSFETVELIQFDKDLTKPSTGLPIHCATVKTLATFTDLDTGNTKEYVTISQGSDTIDKAVSCASTMAFRNWFYKNFTPKGMKEGDLDEGEEEKSQPKVPVYVPDKKKEEIKKEVVSQVQQESSDDEDIKAICENIMKIRELGDNKTYGDKTLQKLMSGNLSSADILEIDLKVKQKLKKVQNG